VCGRVTAHTGRTSCRCSPPAHKQGFRTVAWLASIIERRRSSA
jgi:hypothetical protein